MHGVASSTFYDARARTIKTINSAYADAIHFPWDDTAELQTISDEFYATNKQSLEGCVLAVDGLLVRIQQRTSRDLMNPVAYYTRKGFHALNVQAGCDARVRFRVVSIEHAGSTHDSLAWQNTNAAQHLQSGRLPSRFFFVADDAYVGHDQMLVPWPGRQLPSAPLNSSLGLGQFGSLAAVWQFGAAVWQFGSQFGFARQFGSLAAVWRSLAVWQFGSLGTFLGVCLGRAPGRKPKNPGFFSF